MNNVRRRSLGIIEVQLRELFDSVQEIREEEEESLENMPEGIQESERGELMQEGLDQLDEVLGSITEAGETLEDLINPS